MTNQRVRPPRASALARLLGVLVALALVAAACSSGDSGSDDASGDTGGNVNQPVDAGEPQLGGEITVGIVGESNSWYPPEGEWAFSAGILVADSFYENLFAQSGTGAIVPYLAAERATPNDDATEWTVTLRPGITFHDGTPLDADALVDMSALWEEGRFATPGEGVASTTKIDDLTVVYALHDPDPAFETTLAGNRGVAFSPTAARAFGQDAGENPVGTGPYVFQSWIRDSELTVTRNPNYWQDAQPYLDRITFRVLVDQNSRLASLESGDIDISTQGGTVGAQSLIDKGYTAFEYLGNGGGIIVYNTIQPPMDDARVRRALAQAVDPVDVNAINPGRLSGEIELRSQYFAPSSPWYEPSVDDIYPGFDIDAAESQIESYVNDPNRSDGAAVGDPISFRYLCSPSPTNRLISQLFLQNWADVGLEVELIEQEQGTAISTVIGGPTTDPAFAGDFDVACWADGTESDPLQIFGTRYGDVGTSVVNWSNYTNPDIDAQLEILRTELDVETRKAAAAEISRITAEELPIHWFGSGSTVILAGDRVKNIDIFTWPDGSAGSRQDRGRVYWHEIFVDGAEPITDLPDGVVALPEGAELAEAEEDDPLAALPGPDDAILDALPGSDVLPDGFGTVAPTFEFEQCPGSIPVLGLSPESVTIKTFQGPTAFGPFPGIVVLPLPPGEAEQYLAGYAEGAAGPCADFETVTADGAPLTQVTSTLEASSFGDESAAYALRGASGAFPVNADVFLVRVGETLIITSWLAIGGEPDLPALEALTEATVSAVAGLG